MGAQGDRKDAKMEPKVTEKLVQRHLVERVKSMAGTVRERHGEVAGEGPGTSFFRNAVRRLPHTLLRRVRDDFL